MNNTKTIDRQIELARKTNETDITLYLNLDGNGKYDIKSPLPFFNHMLEQFSKHAGIDLTMNIKGDTEIDSHHTIEDAGIILGQAIKALTMDKTGVERYGNAIVPMDEALVLSALDLSGRSFLCYDVPFTADKLGNVELECFKEFFRALTDQGCFTLHLKLLDGENNHHIAECAFKSFARSFKSAIAITGDQLMSTKGIL